MISRIRSHLGWKLFLSYLIVIIVGVFVLASAAELAIPRSFNRHMAAMGSMMSGMMGNGGMGPDMNADLFSNFRAAVNESMALATIAAFSVAFIVSLLISRRVVTPVLEMMDVSGRIAEGEYRERVKVPRTKSIDDLDELAQLAVSFNQMAEKLEKTESIRTQLIGDIAHELRTPLTSIKGSMEGLIDGILTADVGTFQGILAETSRLQRLVDDLQELSRVEAGSFELNHRSEEISEILRNTVRRIGLQFEEKGVSLTLDTSPDLPPVFVDNDRIGQVLLNLIGNALQYTPPGGVVDVRSWHAEVEVFVEISDTGIGISPEHLPHIFSRFYRVDKSRARASGGSGIGLTIAKHIVEAHGGRIWAESPGTDQGSTFTFTLPIP
ncbi:MAG: sensor histidine kinase [Candidatus Hermodarchaeia archaeon]|jgi:histidine kinase